MKPFGSRVVFVTLLYLALLLQNVGMPQVQASSEKPAMSEEAYITGSTPFYLSPVLPASKPAASGKAVSANKPAPPIKEAGFLPSQIRPYPVWQRQSDWLALQANGKLVWINAHASTVYIRTLEEKTGEDTVMNAVNMFLHHPATVYKDANPLSGSLMDIDPQRITVLKRNKEWYQIRTDYGPGWIYDGAGYITSALGVQKIKIVKPVLLYRYCDLVWPAIGQLTEVPLETVAYASHDSWYKIWYQGDFYWVYAKNGQVQPDPAVFTDRKTVENGYVGNATFMTAPTSTLQSNLFHRMAINIGDKRELLFETFIVRPAGKEERGFTFETYDAANPDAQLNLHKYAADIFASGDQIDQLERAALKVRAYTGNADYKTNIIVGLPNLTGVDTLSKLRMEAAFINDVLSNWKQFHPSALEFKGFYWVNELVPDSDRQFVQSVANMIHDQGYKFYWAPYYQAANAESWKTLGFDFAWLQPNQYFNADKHPSEDMLGDTYNLSRQTGAGTMLEWNWSLLDKPENIQLLNEYLDRGNIMGANRVSMLVYDGEGAIDAFFSSTNKSLDNIRQKFFTYLLYPPANTD